MSENNNEMFECLSQQLNMSPGQIKTAAQQGNAQQLMQNLDSDKAEKVNAILSDPEKAKALLNSPQAQALMKLLNNK